MKKSRLPATMKPPEPLEKDVQRAVLQALSLHPKVRMAWRVNSGVDRPTRKDGSVGWVRYGFPGCPDIMGVMRDGRILACEVKRPSGKITEAQERFLSMVRGSGGVAFVARSVDCVMEALA